jgi:hypothetical protein
VTAEANVIASAHFRCGGAAGREPIAAPGEVASLAASYTPQQSYWGKITSTRPAPMSKGDIELAAFRLGVKPAALVAALRAGVVGVTNAR